MKLAIFDIDGTLVDSVDLHARAWLKALAHFGINARYDRVRSQIGKGGDDLIKEFLTEREVEKIGEALKEYRAGLYKSHYLKQVTPFSHVPALFDKVKEQGTRIAVGSSAKKDEVEHYLKLLRVTRLVDLRTSADDVDKAKPHPDIFSVILEKASCAPADAIVIGDSPFDAIAAKKIGVSSVALLCGGFEEKKLIESGFIALYKNPGDLLKQFGQSPLAAPALPNIKTETLSLS
ncbi:MAG TPA: HAD family hydrolase [Chroococcales cyanobacterium]